MISTGIRVMLKVLKDTNSKSGDLRLAAIEGDVKKVYEMLGFAKTFQLYGSVEETTQSNEPH